MGDRRVDERQELSLRFCRVIQDLLRDVYEADHYFVVFLIWTFDETPLYLEELKFRNILLVNVLHSTDVLDHVVQILLIPFLLVSHLGDVVSHKSFLKGEHFRGQLDGRHFHHFSDRELCLFLFARSRVNCFRVILRGGMGLLDLSIASFAGLSVVLEKVKHLDFISVDIDLLIFCVDSLEEVFETVKVRHNFVGQLVHEHDGVAIHDDDSLLKAIKHTLVHVSLFVRILGLIQELIEQSTVDTMEVWDHNTQKDKADNQRFYCVGCHIVKFEISKHYH